jgi:hypothetical protein
MSQRKTVRLQLHGATTSSISSSAGMFIHPRIFPDRHTVLIIRSLEKEPSKRATPWRMLEHPWMVEMKSKKVNMKKFLQQVWGWQD